MKQFNLEHWARDWFLEQGISEESASYLTLTLDVVLLIAISLLADFITRRVILGFVSSYVKRSKNDYDDIFLEKKVFTGLAHLAPALIIYYSLPWLLDDIALPIGLFQKLVSIYMIVIFLVVVARFLRSLEYIGLRTERFEGKPISSYIQVFILTSYIIGGILIISMVIGRSPLTILTAFGAATAVILLIFRDTILGLVASIQISANDMVRLGDWVSMDKFGADGDVIEINLTTVKVRNWDKTITTVPTYAFIADSFKNWRGMQAMGVRRIKRSINIDISSIQFVSDDMRDRFLKYERVRDFIKQRQSEIDQYNSETKADKSELINGRHMTNIGVFRRYALRYLEEHPKIDQKETVMVRQLQPTEEGIPLEIYAFSSDIAWVNYENIQSDIFDHLIAAVSKFDLRIFQNPSGADFKSLSINSAGDDPSTAERGSQKE
ncbi:MAG: mechanosensitive ion channel family protein [Owenweeksia sp.]